MRNTKLDLTPLLRFMETLPKSGDVELTLLKCHLLIEEVLTQIISKALNNPEHVKGARLSFSQKTHITRATTELAHAPWIWQALKLLNKARNELSHNLTSHEIEEKLEKFIAHVKGHNNEIPEEALNEKFTRFHWAVFATYTVVASHANFDPASVKPLTILGGGNA
jgi:hypothetical protein